MRPESRFYLTLACFGLMLTVACGQVIKTSHFAYPDGRSIDIPNTLTYENDFICNIDGDDIQFIHIEPSADAKIQASTKIETIKATNKESGKVRLKGLNISQVKIPNDVDETQQLRLSSKETTLTCDAGFGLSPYYTDLSFLEFTAGLDGGALLASKELLIDASMDPELQWDPLKAPLSCAQINTIITLNQNGQIAGEISDPTHFKDILGAGKCK